MVYCGYAVDEAIERTIPDRDVFKASDVCEIAQVQAYVLRSWEQEFPNLGVARTPGGPRWYRRHDVERVLRIKQLVFGEGLTLAGVRRRLEGDPVPEPAPPLPDVLDDGVRARLVEIKQQLRALLDMLEKAGEPEQPTLLDAAEGGPWPPPRDGTSRGKGRKRTGR